MRTDARKWQVIDGGVGLGGRPETSVIAVVVGAGRYAEAVISTLRAKGYSVTAVFDDDTSQRGADIMGVSVRGPVAIAGEAGCELGIIAIDDNAVREKLARRLQLRWLTLVHPDAWVAPTAKLGSGTVVLANAVIQAGSIVGEHVIVNTGAIVDHDCRVDDFAHLAPGVHLAGNGCLGQGAFLGVVSKMLLTRWLARPEPWFATV